MSEFKRGNQRNSNDRNKKPNRGGYEKRTYESKPTITMVDKFLEEVKSIVKGVNDQVGNLVLSVNDSKVDFGQISARIDYMNGEVVKKSVNFYYMENRKSKSGEYFNAFIMATHGSSGGVLFSTFGRADNIITKFVPYADTIVARNAGLDVEVKQAV